MSHLMPDGIPFITENMVHQLTTDQSFARGAQLHGLGATYEPIRQGTTLRSYCQGSDATPQSTSVNLSEQGIEGSSCTCPYEGEGLCEHTVALLLTWIHQPEAFRVIPELDLDAILLQYSQAQLIDLVKKMLKYAPDLARIIDLTEPLEASAATPDAVVAGLDNYRLKIDYILQIGYPDARTTATELSAIMAAGDLLREAGDLINAGGVYNLILSEIPPHYEELYDEGGDIGDIIMHCTERLAACLAQATLDRQTHRAWIAALLGTELKINELGGMNLPTPAGKAVIKHATPEEWPWVEQQLRDNITLRQNDITWFGRETLVNLLTSRFESRGLQDKADALLLELGSPTQRAFLLISKERVPEALKLAQQFASMPDLAIQFADALIEKGLGGQAEAYIASMGNTLGRYSYIKWLARYAESQGNTSSAVEYWEQNFWETSTLDNYKLFSACAQPLSDWSTRYTNLVAALEKRKKWEVLFSILLHESDVELAIATLEKMSSHEYTQHAFAVAQAAEVEHPETAIEIYHKLVSRMIDSGGRDNYRDAVGRVLLIQALLKRIGQSQQWPIYISALRSHYSEEPVFLDELEKAGL